MKPKTLVLAALALTLHYAQAQHQTFTVTPEKSEVKMTLNTNHEIVNGTFHVQSGSISYDRASPALSGGVSVAAGSGNTGNGSRDKKMHKDVLLSEKYTTVTFAPKSYTGTIAATGDSTIQVTGTLTLLGNPHEITTPMQLHLDGANSSAKTHFSIPYVQWGLKDPSFMMWKTEKEVAIDLNLAGQTGN